MEGTRIASRLATVDRDQASELVKRLYGQATSSHGGTYAVRRKGLPNEIPCRALIWGVDRRPWARPRATLCAGGESPAGANLVLEAVTGAGRWARQDVRAEAGGRTSVAPRIG